MFRKVIFVSISISIFLIIYHIKFFNVYAGVLDTAKEYAEFQWSPTKENVEHEVYTHFNTKCRFNIGDKVTGVAYAWWQWNTVTQFDEGIKNKKAAGLHAITTEEKSWCDKAAGTDCSGFISCLWNQSQKLSTYTLINVADRIPIWDAQENDVWNSRNHVKWISSTTSNGFNGYHASNGKNKVVSYQNETSNDFINSGYYLFRKGRIPVSQQL